MLKKIRVDREDELVLLHKIALGEIEHRILLISADAGIGKSELLREFIFNCPRNILVVPIDFKNGSISQVDLLFTVCETLGWSLFPKAKKVFDSASNIVSVNVSGNLLIGQNDVSVIINGLGKNASAAYLPSLTKSFFDDLRRLERVMFIFDTFENAHPLLREWVMNVFLHYIRFVPNLSVVVSGRDAIEPALGWDHITYRMRLSGIEPVHWHRYLQSKGSSVELVIVESICSAINMQTIKMAEFVSIYLDRMDEAR